ncbi:metalloregulator ArsR/SmtB family transcription factor [Agromyces mediolanus]|uniref:metalloregulator ArsR/SmtB family transcription factor n=1 Tax=Agromyces mediolanus TaxID=41986 RepID=UPI00383701E6
MDGARALADPVRREILELLRASPQPAGRIAERFPISRPAVSKHLHVLLECGAVTVTTRGRERVYELRTEPFDELAAYLAVLTAPPFAPQLDALATEVARTRRERRTADAARSTAPGPEQNRRRRA